MSIKNVLFVLVAGLTTGPVLGYISVAPGKYRVDVYLTKDGARCTALVNMLTNSPLKLKLEGTAAQALPDALIAPYRIEILVPKAIIRTESASVKLLSAIALPKADFPLQLGNDLNPIPPPGKDF